MDDIKHTFGPIEYYQSGEAPEILIVSGMHGDEREVIGCLWESVTMQADRLPHFLYIPRVSPSAVSSGTRLNAFGHDINRSFLSPAPDEESDACMNVLSGHSFRYSLDFHEDPDRNSEFYLYDSGVMSDPDLAAYRAIIHGIGVSLYTGLDDESDPTLGFQVTDGYVSIHHELSSKDTGFSTGWLLRHRIVQRAFTFEIPGKSPMSQKQALVNTLTAYFTSGRHDTIPM